MIYLTGTFMRLLIQVSGQPSTSHAVSLRGRGRPRHTANLASGKSSTRDRIWGGLWVVAFTHRADKAEIPPPAKQSAGCRNDVAFFGG
jgi:hypothetical protein